jgi:hypothetical protein
MATKQDLAAAKQRKQKIFLAVAGVLFLGLAVIQGPKLMKQLKGSSDAVPAAQTTSTSSTSSPTSTSTPVTPGAPVVPGTVSSAPKVKAPKSATTQLAGVYIVTEQPVAAGDGQLDSFSMFEPKDPFVPQVDPNAHPDDGSGSSSSSTPSSTPSGGSDAGTSSSAGAGTGSSLGGVSSSVDGTTGTQTAPAAPPVLALIRVNGVLSMVGLKNRFPKVEKSFVLRKLSRKGTAVIGVAGGSFAKGASLTLRVGKPVTLVNTATGTRFVVKLVWLGADASNLARFSTPAK